MTGLAETAGGGGLAAMAGRLPRECPTLKEGNTDMKKIILLLACVALPMAAFADTPTTTTKKAHKGHHKTAASPAPAASPAAKASPAPKASPSPEAK
jgi:hypothetical protein